MYFVSFVIVYVILAATTGMFFITWGAKRSVLEKMYVFFIGFPFNWSKSLWFLPMNGVVWASFFYLLALGVRRIFIKKVK